MIRAFLAVLALGLLLLGCGYLQSAFSPVESTSTTLSGSVVDSLSGKTLSGVTVILSGLRDTTLQTDSNGVFMFKLATTGVKRLAILKPGYRVYERSMDLASRPNELDTIRLLRNNHPPRVNRFVYPVPNSYNIPLTLKFKWSLSDSDFAYRDSRENLNYRFYFGRDSLTATAVDSGAILSDDMNFDHDGLLDTLSYYYSYIINRPESLFANLDSNTTYYWHLEVVDFLGDSTATPWYRFLTRENLAPCPDSMALVELGTDPSLQPFCMDKYEFSNQKYVEFDPNYLYYSRTDFSGDLNMPALDVTRDSADTACRRLNKRLCTITEWQAAVRGYDSTQYPYGNDYDPSLCNTTPNQDNPFIAAQAFPVDSPLTCVSSYGIYDLSGNASEWVVRVSPYQKYDGVGNTLKYYVGGAWWSKEKSGLNSVMATTWDNLKHIGFRCCKDAN